MSENVLHAEIREVTGKEFAKKLRKHGKIPGIFYAHDEKPVAIIVDERDTMKILTSESGLIDIQIGKKRKRKAIIKDAQADPVKQTLLHIDVMGVRLKEKIHVEVPIQFMGDAVGVKDHGGVLHQYLRAIEVSCLPLDIPDHIEVDVTNLNIGDSISLSSLSIENVEILGDPEQPIVNVLPPTVVKVPVAEEVEAVEEEKEEVSEEKPAEE
ncbi:MAG: 50S ribosomal protein L25 [bacterium]|nr:MAG: 50S ribosomal protein L25 [bacterium]